MIFNFIDLKELREGDRVKGHVYVKEFKKKVDFTSKAPLYGTLHFKGYTMPFKVWDNSIQAFLNELSLTSFVVEVEGVVTSYKEKLELQVNNLFGVVEKGYEHYVFKSLDVNDLAVRFGNFITDNISKDYRDILEKVFSKDNLWGKFVYSWCASRMHDACVGGLLNHTLKMLNIAKAVVENDSRWEDKKDLIYVGIIFHDIGKVLEIENGSYTDISFVTHRVLGVEILHEHKDFIVSKIGKENYYHLLAIISQHHDEYAERASTVYSRFIHLVDMLESFVTGAMDRLENRQYYMYNDVPYMTENDRNLRY